MAFHILTVCTGNICRSPTAERLLRHRLQSLLGEPDPFVVTSAGTAALVGEPIQPDAAALLVAAGVDTSDFNARMLDASQVERADLVLAMTRRHRSATATAVPRALPRLFTLREFARLAEAAAADLRATDCRDAEAWARSLVPAAASKRGWVRPDAPDDDDVDDPYGGPASGYREPFELIERAVGTIAQILAGPFTRDIVGRSSL